MRINRAPLSRIPSVVVIGILSTFLLSVPFFAFSVNSQGNQASAQYGPSMSISIVPGASTKSNDAFSPSFAQVSIGTIVTWTNNDSALHTVESGANATPDGKFGVQSDGQTPILVPPGKTMSYTTTAAGTFSYFCSLHPAMVGTLQVNSPSTPKITVYTDKSSYSTGDYATVYGNIGTTSTGKPLLIRVYDSDSSIIKFDQFAASSDGSFSYKFQLGGIMRNTGWYSVKVSLSEVEGQTSFYFTSTQAERTWNTALMNTPANTYSISYQITGGSLLSLKGDSTTSTITAAISSYSDGQLIIQLPRTLADARANGQIGADTDYVVFVDGTEDFADDDHGASVRTLTIPFAGHSQQIDITGTFVVGQSSPPSSSISASTNKATYSPGESVAVSGIVTNANTANYITVTVFDSKGAVFKVDQFHPNSGGSYAYTFVLSGTAAAGDWSVSVAYGSSKATVHFSVQDSTSGAFPFKITGSQTTDISGNPVSVLHAGSPIMVNLSATNTKPTQQSMIIILQIENSEGITEFLSWQSSNVAGNQSMTAGFGWTPEGDGSYKLKALVWQSIGSPIPLADPLSSTISVV